MNYEQNYSGAKLHNIRISFSLDVMQKRPISYFLKNAKILQNRSFLKKWTNPGLVHFRSFQTNISIFTANHEKKCQFHPAYGTGIQNHDLFNMSCIP